MAEASLLVLAIKETGEVALTAQRHLSEQQQALARVAAVQIAWPNIPIGLNKLVGYMTTVSPPSWKREYLACFLPKGLDGDEVNPMTCALVCEVAASDTAAAWHIMVFNAAKLMAAKWPAELVETLWGDQPDRLVAASGHTPLKGKRVDGGVEIWGTQRFVSGCNFAEWIMSPVLMDGDMHNAVIAW